MIKACPVCNKPFEGNIRRKYCSPACRKAQEVSLRVKPKNKPQIHEEQIIVPCQEYLNEIAAAHWNKLAPTLLKRGHLHVISEDAFAELCDLYSRLREINKFLDDNNRALLQIDEQYNNKTGVETSTYCESEYSKMKRMYSARYLDYCKQFYLTPLSNRGNFGLQDDGKEAEEKSDGFDT